MSDGPAANAFLSRIPTFAAFAEIADPARYEPLPEDWLVGLSDVVRSTEAIAAGRYKAVNTAGAAVISAVSNAVGHGAFPFVFGGDGASFAVPPEWAEKARGALATTAVFVAEELDLSLRVALVPVRAIREAGLDIRVARFEASPNVTYAMFSGGGLVWAEAQVKAGAFAVPAAPAGSRPDLSGLSCRFDEMPSRRGTILSLIVRAAPGGDPARYRSVIEDVLALIEASSDMARPVPGGGPSLGWPGGFELEARMMQRRPAGSLGLARLWVLARTAGAYLILRFRIPIGGFDPGRYLADVVANSDYRKYDDGLRMTIDCALQLADAIETRLLDAAGRGDVVYGLHRQAAALMTCLTPSAVLRDHIHFVDGAAGGYAAAAAGLKAGTA